MNIFLENNSDTGIAIFTYKSNLAFLCNEADGLFVDGRFKLCPKFFYQNKFNVFCTCTQERIFCIISVCFIVEKSQKMCTNTFWIIFVRHAHT